MAFTVQTDKIGEYLQQQYGSKPHALQVKVGKVASFVGKIFVV